MRPSRRVWRGCRGENSFRLLTDSIIVVFVLFFIAMRSRPAAEQIWIGRGFFVWVSVFNLFNTAIFWAFMTDLFTVERENAFTGSSPSAALSVRFSVAYITKYYVREIGPANLLVIAAAMFAIAGFLVRFFPHGLLNNTKPLLRHAKNQSADRSGRASRTFAARLTSWGLPQAFCFIRRLRPGRIFNRATAGGVLKTSTARTEFFGTLEIWVNSITVLIQIFLTGRLLKWFGVAFTLVSLPFLSMVGFAAMGIAASLAMLAVFQVARRAAAYALMRPSRRFSSPC